MEKSIKSFKEFLTSKKNYSQNTTDGYMRDILQFYDFCLSNGTRNFLEVDRDYINKYLEYLSFKGKSASTCSRIIASLRAFFKHLASENVISINPIDGIKQIKSEQDYSTV